MQEFVEAERARILARIAQLNTFEPRALITCPICDGTADPQCGCDGLQRVAYVIRYLEGQLEILEK